jgi:hypothetical protein
MPPTPHPGTVPTRQYPPHTVAPLATGLANDLATYPGTLRQYRRDQYPATTRRMRWALALREGVR